MMTASELLTPEGLIQRLKKGSPIVLVGGIFEGAAISKEKIIELSRLPGKKDLLGMLVGTLNGVPGAFVRALNAIAEKHGTPEPAKVEAPAPAAEAPKAEEPKVEEAKVEAPAAPAAPAEEPKTEAPAEVAAPAAEEKKEEAPATDAPAA